jgi:SAM-dependent methyltransferase
MQRSPIRESYEKYPYPAADETALSSAWRLPPFEWITALCGERRKSSAPQRILVAGCGTGNEAFALRRRFPKAHIAAIDFSPRSISIARRLQRRASEMRNIIFVVGDLTHRSLGGITGAFDFISCHGVLSYIQTPERALANLSRRLKPAGALYLGVNGAEHFSASGRSFLPAFGCDLADMRDGLHLRKLLKLWDAVLQQSGRASFTRFSATYLASDLFGSFIQNLPLTQWLGLARGTGLYFRGSCSCWRALRSVMEKDFPRLLLPRSHAEICELLEILRPASFHRLLFTREPAANPPWENLEALLASRPMRTNLYAVRLPKRAGPWQRLRAITFKSRAINTRLDWKMPEWELEILRQSDGERTLAEILGEIPFSVPSNLLRRQLYVLHQLLVMKLTEDLETAK